jgi:hypothetical protein
MIDKTLIKIILILTFTISICFNVTADEDINLRGKGGALKTNNTVPKKIRIGTNLLNIKKFKSTFVKYNTQNKKEKMIMSSLKNGKTKKM